MNKMVEVYNGGGMWWIRFVWDKWTLRTISLSNVWVWRVSAQIGLNRWACLMRKKVWNVITNKNEDGVLQPLGMKIKYHFQ